MYSLQTYIHTYNMHTYTTLNKKNSYASENAYLR